MALFSITICAHTDFDQIGKWVEMFLTECVKADTPVVMRSNPALYSRCCLWVWSEHEPFVNVGKFNGERRADKRRKRRRREDIGDRYGGDMREVGCHSGRDSEVENGEQTKKE